MIIFTHDEIEKVVKGVTNFLEKRRENKIVQKKTIVKVSCNKRKSQQKNWSKWKKRKKVKR